jgi:hypothetical protein
VAHGLPYNLQLSARGTLVSLGTISEITATIWYFSLYRKPRTGDETKGAWQILGNCPLQVTCTGLIESTTQYPKLPSDWQYCGRISL